MRGLLEYDTETQVRVAERLSRDSRGQTVFERLGQVLDKWVTYAKNAVRKLAGRSAEVRQVRAAAERDVERVTRLAESFRRLRQGAGQIYEARTQAGEEVQEGGERYSVQQLEDGTKYVEVDTDQGIFDGVAREDIPKTIERYMTDRFRGTIIGEGDTRAWVDRRAAKEYARPERRGIDDDLYEAKARAGTELDNLMKVARFDRHEQRDQADTEHPENTGGWDYYNVYFSVPGTEYLYEGRMIIEYVKKGRRFHDMTHVKETSIPRPGRNARQVEPGLSEDTLAQNGAERNRNSGQQRKKDIKYLAAVNRGDMYTAARMVEEAAEKAGYVRFGDFYADKTLELTQPEPTSTEREMFGFGKKYGDSEAGYRKFMTENPDMMERMINSSIYERWYLAGTRNEMPEYKLAIRYGDIPEGNRSRNWATNELERGVSTVSLLSQETQKGQTIYDMIYGMQGTQKYIIGGWDFGIRGSDGEKLLVGAKRIIPFSGISKLKAADAVTYDDAGNVIPLSQRFNAQEEDIRYSLEEEAGDEEAAREINGSAASDRTGVRVDAGTRSAYADVRLSLETYNESDYVKNRDKMVRMIAKMTGRDEETVEKWFDAVSGIAATIAADRGRLDYTGLRNAQGELVNSALKPNAEYGGSIEKGRSCRPFSHSITCS